MSILIDSVFCLGYVLVLIRSQTSYQPSIRSNWPLIPQSLASLPTALAILILFLPWSIILHHYTLSLLLGSPVRWVHGTFLRVVPHVFSHFSKWIVCHSVDTMFLVTGAGNWRVSYITSNDLFGTHVLEVPLLTHPYEVYMPSLFATGNTLEHKHWWFSKQSPFRYKVPVLLAHQLVFRLRKCDFLSILCRLHNKISNRSCQLWTIRQNFA